MLKHTLCTIYYVQLHVTHLYSPHVACLVVYNLATMGRVTIAQYPVLIMTNDQ